MDEILNLLKDNARISIEDIAAMTKKSCAEVREIIAKLEADGTILKYQAIVNPASDAAKKVRAVIELQVVPEREHGFDLIAEKIFRFPQVKSLYLISGGGDLQATVEGDSLESVSSFLAHKLATIDGVRGTKTQFIMQTYKENDIVCVPSKTDLRQKIMA